MSEPLKRELYALPFFVADAWLERLTAIFDDPRLKSSTVTMKRHQLSTGSARIDVSFRQKKIGWLRLFASSERITFFEVSATDDRAAQQLMLTLFNLYHVALTQVTASAIQGGEQLEAFLRTVRGEVTTGVAAVSETVPSGPSEPGPPQRDDPVDAWLDWREAERKRGRRWTLAQLAEQSNWSEGTLKKYSARRKKPSR